MKLYLSSYRIPSPGVLFELVEKKPEAIKTAFITNAWVYKTLDEYELSLKEAKDYFLTLGLQAEAIDLRSYDNPEELKAKLTSFDLIWSNGGNTFILLYEMKRVGFEGVIRELLDEGKVYGGESAGAIVAGTSLKGIEFADEPELAKEVHWDGLGLINKAILPHADSPDPRYVERVPEFRKQYSDNPDNLIVLNDNEAYVVDGNTAQKVSTPYKPGTHEVAI